MTTIATIDRCRCSTRHRSIQRFVECALGDPKPIWVHGIGPYAVIASCGEDWHYRRLVRGGTVLLRKTEAEAPRHLVQIDDTACGGNCRRDHEIVRVEFQG